MVEYDEWKVADTALFFCSETGLTIDKTSVRVELGVALKGPRIFRIVCTLNKLYVLLFTELSLETGI